MAAAIKLSGNRAGWLTRGPALIMEGGDRPPSRQTLYRKAAKRVGSTAVNDGHVTAALNGLPRNDFIAGQRMFVDFWLDRLRAEGWVGGDDDALVWTGPLTGDMDIIVDGKRFGSPTRWRRGAKDEGKIADVLVGRGHVNRVKFYEEVVDRGGVRGEDRAANAARPGGAPARVDDPADDGDERSTSSARTCRRTASASRSFSRARCSTAGTGCTWRRSTTCRCTCGSSRATRRRPRAYVFSANIVRRHLTTPQKVLAVPELFMPEGRTASQRGEGRPIGRSPVRRDHYRNNAVVRGWFRQRRPRQAAARSPPRYPAGSSLPASIER